jgi:drug/metabolite transporter (DMT)-like permease
MVVTSALEFPIGAYTRLSLAPVAHGAVIVFGGLPIATVLAGWLLFGERPTPARLVSLGRAQFARHAVVALFLCRRALNALGAGPPTLIPAPVPGLASLGARLLLGERLGWPGAAGVALASIGMAIGIVRLPRLARRSS